LTVGQDQAKRCQFDGFLFSESWKELVTVLEFGDDYWPDCATWFRSDPEVFCSASVERSGDEEDYEDDVGSDARDGSGDDAVEDLVDGWESNPEVLEGNNGQDFGFVDFLDDDVEDDVDGFGFDVSWDDDEDVDVGHP
jgi:hypothetical protein